MKQSLKIKIFFLVVFLFQNYQQAHSQVGFKEKGVISYYTDRFADRKTASGEKFDNNALVGCHNKIPFNSKVKVTNTANGKSVIVRINDRGPYAYGRIMDISKAAAEIIDLISTGTAKVEIEVIAGPEVYAEQNKPQSEGATSTNTSSSTTTLKESENSTAEFKVNKTYSQWGTVIDAKGYTLQLIGYSNIEDAIDFCKMLRSNGFENEKIFIRPEPSGAAVLYKVLLGVADNKEDIQVLQKRYLGLIKKPSFIRVFER